MPWNHFLTLRGKETGRAQDHLTSAHMTYNTCTMRMRLGAGYLISKMGYYNGLFMDPVFSLQQQRETTPYCVLVYSILETFVSLEHQVEILA